jgi:hypothetical protein
MKRFNLLNFALAAVLAGAASAATVRKADDTVVSGEVVGIEDGKVLVSQSAPVAAGAAAKLTGTVIGTDGSWNDEGNTREKAMDGNVATFFDAQEDVAWVGLDLGKPHVMTQVRYCPRAPGNGDFAQRMIGGKFQGSNSADFSTGVVDLHTVVSAPPQGTLTTGVIANSGTFRYVRYLSPEKGHCNVAEVEFWGKGVAAPTTQAVKGAQRIPLEDIAIITLREKPRPVEPAANTGQPQMEQVTVLGGVMNFLFGGGMVPPVPQRVRGGQNQTAAAQPPAPPTTRPAHSGQWQVKLQGEDRWTGLVKSWSEKKVQFQPDASPDVIIDVPVERLREVWKGSAALVAQARAMKIAAGTEDVAFIEKDNQVHDVKGLVVGIEADLLVFRYGDADRKINLNRLVGITFASPQVVKDEAFHQAVELMSGDVISGQCKAMAGNSVEIETAWGKAMKIPLDSVANIQCRNGKLVYVSDLTPAHVEQVPYFDRVFPWRADVSISGGQLRLLDGVYDKGLAVHSRCVLEYDIGGKFEQFKAHVGFQQPEGLAGQCVIRVLGDGKVLYENVDARGDRPPVDVEAGVKGMSRLTLEVDFGEGQDVADRVVWGNARLLRAQVQK